LRDICFDGLKRIEKSEYSVERNPWQEQHSRVAARLAHSDGSIEARGGQSVPKDIQDDGGDKSGAKVLSATHAVALRWGFCAAPHRDAGSRTPDTPQRLQLPQNIFIPRG